MGKTYLIGFAGMRLDVRADFGNSGFRDTVNSLAEEITQLLGFCWNRQEEWFSCSLQFSAAADALKVEGGRTK